MANHFEFYSGLRGYHVYKNSADWKPYEKEKVTLKREKSNKQDKFAVAGRVTMRGRFGWILLVIYRGKYHDMYGTRFWKEPSMR